MSYEVLVTIPSKQTFTRIGQGVQNGERWDKILLDNGMIGYVFQTYVAEALPPKISAIYLEADRTSINVGDEEQINIRIEPSDAEGEIVWSSSNNAVATVQNGKVTAISGGSAVITAKTSDGAVYGSLNFEVKVPAQNINLDVYNLQLIEGKTMKINATVTPENATNKKLVWSSDNPTIAEVNQSGEIVAVAEGDTAINVRVENENVSAKCNVKVIKVKENSYFELDKSVQLNGDEISGLSSNIVADFKKLVKTNLNMEFYDAKGNLLSDDSLIGTGYRLCLRDNSGDEVYNYYFILYGDVNGDGYINSLDVLVLQKYILELRTLDELYLKAGNISKNGNLPSSLDVLKIQKHILEVKIIEQ